MNVTGTSLTERKEKRSKRREQEDQENGDEASAGFGTGFDDNDADDDENWSTDVSKEAVKKRMKELTSGVKGLAMDDDIEKPESERVNILLVFVKDKLAIEAGFAVAVMRRAKALSDPEMASAMAAAASLADLIAAARIR